MKTFRTLIVCLIANTLFTACALAAKTSQKSCVGQKETFHDGNFAVTVTKFSPAIAHDKLVLIMPPTGGVTRIERSYAKALCERNIAATVLTGWTDDQEYNIELEIHQRLYLRAQRAIDLVLSHANEKNIGILGTSLGAFHAAIAAMRIERITSVFLIVGGAPITSIIAQSDQKILSDAKEKRIKLFGFQSLDEYEAALRKIIPFEPLNMTRVGEPLRVGMVISNSDGTVPTRFQHQLREAWKPELVIESSFGHIGTIVKTWLFDKNKIVNFFEK